MSSQRVSNFNARLRQFRGIWNPRNREINALTIYEDYYIIMKQMRKDYFERKGKKYDPQVNQRY